MVVMDFDFSVDDDVTLANIMQHKFWASVVTKCFLGESSKKARVTKMLVVKALYHQLFDSHQGMHDSESSSEVRHSTTPKVNTNHRSAKKNADSTIDDLLKEFRDLHNLCIIPHVICQCQRLMYSIHHLLP